MLRIDLYVSTYVVSAIYVLAISVIITINKGNIGNESLNFA